MPAGHCLTNIFVKELVGIESIGDGHFCGVGQFIKATFSGTVLMLAIQLSIRKSQYLVCLNGK